MSFEPMNDPAPKPMETLADIQEAIAKYKDAIGSEPDCIVCGLAQKSFWNDTTGNSRLYLTYMLEGGRMRLKLFGIPVFTVDTEHFQTILC